MTKAIPEGFRTLTASLNIEGADKAIELYKGALGAAIDGDIMKCPQTGKVMHAVLNIGDSKIMLADVMPNCPIGATHSSFLVYLPDVDTAFKKATKAGMKSHMEPQDMFWGDRMGSLMDPFGNNWSLATHVKDMSKDEIDEAGKEWMQNQQSKAA